MTPRPRPMLGMLLGALLALVVVALMWQLGVVDPGRTVVFVTLAIGVLAVAGLLTRQVSAARGRFVTVAVLSGVLAGVGVTGIPQAVSVGSVSDGCTLEASAGGMTASPSDTDALTTFAIRADDTVQWAMTAEEPISVDLRVGGFRLAGFDVPIQTVTVVPPAPAAEQASGTVDVAEVLAEMRDRTGLDLTGVYHVFGEVSGEGGACELDGWVSLSPDGVFGTSTLVGLWIALGVLLILIAWAAFAVRASFRRAQEEAIDAARVHSGTVTTAAGATLAGGAAAGHVAADAEPSGATSPDGAAPPAVAPAPAFTPSPQPEEEPPARIDPAPSAVDGAGADEALEGQGTDEAVEDGDAAEAEPDAESESEVEPEPGEEPDEADEADEADDPAPEDDRP